MRVGEQVREAPGDFLRAAFNDAAQRLLTGNKLQQRVAIERRLRGMPGLRRGRVLDFGCGTGLFERPLRRLGFEYVGYDVDAALLSYAARLRPASTWVSDWRDAAALSPYDLILANCCFHHIPDAELQREVLAGISSVMRPGSLFFLIDVLPPEAGASTLRRAYAKLERGGMRRTVEQLDRLLQPYFITRRRDTERSHVLSLGARWNPIYTCLVKYELLLPPER